jgi:hypothetical protein
MFPNPELYWQIARQQRRESMRDAEQWRLSQSSPQPTWLSQQIRWLLRQLGRWLIRMSQPPKRTDRCRHGRLTP